MNFVVYIFPLDENSGAVHVRDFVRYLCIGRSSQSPRFSRRPAPPPPPPPPDGCGTAETRARPERIVAFETKRFGGGFLPDIWPARHPDARLSRAYHRRTMCRSPWKRRTRAACDHHRARWSEMNAFSWRIIGDKQISPEVLNDLLWIRIKKKKTFMWILVVSQIVSQIFIGIIYRSVT